MNSGKTDVKGRDYNTDDYLVLFSFGSSSALVSIMTFCFYIQSDTPDNQFQEPTLLWLILPALGYWILRMWVKTNRGEMHDDPIVYSIRDRGSLITITFIGLITILAQII